MPNTTTVRAQPDQFNGITLTTGAIAWSYSPWVTIISRTPSDIYITGLNFETNFVFSADDNTQEQLFEIGIGRPDNAVTVIQIPRSARGDTRASFYKTQAFNCFLPEPYAIVKGKQVCVRVARDKATAVTYGAVKLIVQSAYPITHPNALTINNYLFAHGSMSSGETIR